MKNKLRSIKKGIIYVSLIYLFSLIKVISVSTQTNFSNHISNKYGSNTSDEENDGFCGKYQQRKEFQQQLPSYSSLPRNSSSLAQFQNAQYPNHFNSSFNSSNNNNNLVKSDNKLPIENNQDSSFYLLNNQELIYQDFKKYKLNNMASTSTQVVRNDINSKQTLGFQNGYINSSQPVNTSSIQENGNLNYALSRNDDILINNFRPFSNNGSMTGSNILNTNNGIHNSSHQGLSASVNYNSQPTLSSSSSNSRLMQANSCNNTPSQYYPQRVSANNATTNNRNPYSTQFKSQTEFHMSNFEKSYSKQYDSSNNPGKLARKQFDGSNQTNIQNNRQNNSSNYNRSNSFANTTETHSPNHKSKSKNFDEQEYYKRWDTQSK